MPSWLTIEGTGSSRIQNIRRYSSCACPHGAREPDKFDSRSGMKIVDVNMTGKGELRTRSATNAQPHTCVALYHLSFLEIMVEIDLKSVEEEPSLSLQGPARLHGQVADGGNVFGGGKALKTGIYHALHLLMTSLSRSQRS